jgi:hypothetical protein
MNIRRRSLTDSLQLLVDTICNLFGSIVIISLLMSLLSKDTSTDAGGGARGGAVRRPPKKKQKQQHLSPPRPVTKTPTPPIAPPL